MGWQHGDPHFFSTVHFSTTLDPVYSDYEDSSFVPFYHIDEDYDYPYFVSKISNVGSYTTNKQALIGDNDEEMVVDLFGDLVPFRGGLVGVYIALT